VPRDVRIMCGYYERREKSPAFFSELGFTTAAGAYYDGATLENPKGWLETLDRNRGAVGHVYDVAELFRVDGAFGDLVSPAYRPERLSTPGR
jgi:hypothetical protein